MEEPPWPKAESISNRGTFSVFSKTERSIYDCPKIPAWNWSSSYLFCYGAWVQIESVKLQRMCACTDKTGSSRMKLVWLIQIAGWLANQRNQSRLLFPDLFRKDRSDSASRVLWLVSLQYNMKEYLLAVSHHLNWQDSVSKVAILN